MVKPSEIEQENNFALQRWKSFRIAAEYVAREMCKNQQVQKISLFGSVAKPLKKEVSRFRKYRRYGHELYHDCKDVDLAVWLSNCDDLRSLQKANSAALKQLFSEKNIGVAHHQVDIFIMQPETNRYLGRLCWYNQCPKHKPDCDTERCGETPFLKQHPDFIFGPEALNSANAVILYER